MIINYCLLYTPSITLLEYIMDNKNYLSLYHFKCFTFYLFFLPLIFFTTTTSSLSFNYVCIKD